MSKDDIAETYKFVEDSNFGILEGSVTIIETKGEWLKNEVKVWFCN